MTFQRLLLQSFLQASALMLWFKLMDWLSIVDWNLGLGGWIVALLVSTGVFVVAIPLGERWKANRQKNKALRKRGSQ